MIPQPDISIERIPALDVLRGVAVLGILWINIIVFGLPSGGYALPSYLGDAVNLNISFWVFSELMIDGAMRGLFSCLFGASAMIYLSKNKLFVNGIDRIEYYYRRNLILILIGLIHAYLLLWPYDVLFAYGLLGLFLFPLRRLPAVALIVAGCVFIIVSDMTFFEINYVTESENSQTILERRNKTEEPKKSFSKEEIEEYKADAQSDMMDDIDLHLVSYADLFKLKYASTVEQHSLYMYTTHIYDIGGMMLLGMALFRLGVLQGYRSRNFYLVLMLLGFVVGISLRAPNIILEINQEFIPDNPDSPMPVNFGISRLPIMLGYIGLVLWLYKLHYFRIIFKILASVGKMALTNYISQTVICIFLFYGIGFGLIGVFEHYQLALLCIAIWFIQGLFSVIWLKRYRYGPLEWLWRSATYAKWQPILNDPVKQAQGLA